jgi:hypothetical protein
MMEVTSWSSAYHAKCYKNIEWRTKHQLGHYKLCKQYWAIAFREDDVTTGAALYFLIN